MSQDPFAQAEQDNRERYAREALARRERELMWKRRNDPLPAGSLFDEVTRATVDLFNPGA